jgi:hypothetical protein
MIKNDQELQATLERIRYFQQQVEKLRQVETNPTNYRLSASGYLTEIDRMHLVVLGRNNPSLYTVNGRPLYVHLNGLAIVLLK